MATLTPNPGSEAALELGCTCPVLDNNHGSGSDWGYNKFWINGNCKVHMPKKEKLDDSAAG
jgi:hypothetical protein